MKSLAVQIHAMRKRWPGFDLVHGFESDSVIWFGNLVGLERPFRVSVEYGLPTGPESPMFRLMPVVRVISPNLVLNFDAEDEAPLPHVFFDKEDIVHSPLCLFDPAEGQWNKKMLIAHTTIPWAVDWLACYESWEATGRWYGGGRHADADEVRAHD
ncbi:MAG: hypothetical protein IID38_04000 [Planctomycetes bacterium]|nr:hypothetical protein [Planctomycetota bacterium]